MQSVYLIVRPCSEQISNPYMKEGSKKQNKTKKFLKFILRIEKNEKKKTLSD
jgi:hypothetical protein